ncbi:MAG TPA: biotin--[acetyl-CoA-carboxylase] ligase [Ruania sp.]|nr:biotin--[acetyl-CoA-carboxylase] ligase [Ruania sp.]
MKHTPSEAELPPLQVVAEAGSTNADLARRAVQDPQQWPHLSGLLARRQVAGRGRSGRSWTSGDGALTFSVLVRPGQEREQWGWLPLLAGAAVVRAVAQHSGPPTGIGALVGVKWPNDVVHTAGGEELPDWGRMRKLAGLLAETLTDGTGVVLGIGVNLRADELPVAWAGAADEVGCTAGPLELAETIRAQLSGLFQQWDATEDPAGLVAPVCRTLGERVRVEMPGGAQVAGLATALAQDGALVVRSDDHQEHVVRAGDVRHLRTAEEA